LGISRKNLISPKKTGRVLTLPACRLMCCNVLNN
jgi:hypothetical protein